jgi:microsomal epoxide hydrolase
VATGSAKARAFAIDVPQAVLDRIATKLALAEVGYAPANDAKWRYGMDARWLAGLLDHWRTRYDGRAAERAITGTPISSPRWRGRTCISSTSAATAPMPSR